MHEAASKADEDPDRLSFSHAVQVVRRKAPAGFPATVCVAGQPGDVANDIRALDR